MLGGKSVAIVQIGLSSGTCEHGPTRARHVPPTLHLFVSLPRALCWTTQAYRIEVEQINRTSPNAGQLGHGLGCPKVTRV